MKRLGLNIFLGIVVGWFALLDHCLIVASGMPISGEIVFLLLWQASIGALILLLVNGAFSIVSNSPNARTGFFVFGVPLIILLASPAMISESMYRVRYGKIDKFVLHAHVGHDLECCWNPF